MHNIIEEIQTASRTISGTDWPVYDQLVRTGARQWTVIRELCNGVPRSAEDYTTETAARETFGARVTGPKPRAGSVASVRLELRLTPAERDRWQALADRQGLRLAELVRESVEMAVARGASR